MLPLAPVDWRGWRVILYAQALRLRVPFWPAGLVWLRPWHMEVFAPDQSHRRVPLHDLTRFLLLGIGALTLVSLALLWRAGRAAGVGERSEVQHAET
jgi:hypothetical protein